MMRRAKTLQLAPMTSLVLVVLIAFSDSARAHDEGVLTLLAPTAFVGGRMTVDGERFSAGISYRLVLKGALREYDLVSVEADSAGVFTAELNVPATAAPGSYRLVAVAPDGDEAAEVDLELEAMPATAQSSESESSEPHAVATGPSAEDLVIERRWSGFEWFVIGVLFGGGLAAGVALSRRPRAT
jgi:hypothetical protein